MIKGKKRLVLSLIVIFIAIASIAAAILTVTLTRGKSDIVGVYLYSGNNGQYRLIIEEENMFSLHIGDETLVGKYTLRGKKLTLSYYENEKGISATYKDSTIKLSYNGEDMLFRKYAQFTVTFIVDKTIVEEQKVTAGAHAQRITDPIKEGSIFFGWFKDDGWIEPYDFDDEVYGDLTLYGYFQEIGRDCNVTLIAGEGSFSTGESELEISAQKGEELVLVAPTPFDACNAFMGWYDGDRKVSGELCEESIIINGDITLYAKWTEAFSFGPIEGGYKVGAGSGIDELQTAVLPSSYNQSPVVCVGNFGTRPNLKKIILPSSINQVEHGAFMECSSLIDIQSQSANFVSENGILYDDHGTLLFYPHGRTEPDIEPNKETKAVGREAFAGSKVVNVTLPDSVVKIEMSAFVGSTIETIVCSGKLQTVGDYAFAQTDIESAIFPTSVQRIKSRAFYKCEKLHKITFNAGIIESEAFFGTTSLDNIVLASGITFIGKSAFEQSGITELTVPDSVTEIEERAFFGSSIQKVSFKGKAIEAINPYVFAECKKLETVNFDNESALRAILAHAFDNSPVSSLVIPPLLEYVDKSCFIDEIAKVTLTQDYDGKLNEFLSTMKIGSIVASACSAFSDIDGALYDKTRERLIIYPIQRKADTYVIPSSCSEINAGVFNGNPYIKTVDFSASAVTEIKDGTFDGCASLVNIILPAAVKTIGDAAFKNCELLENIDLAHVESLGSECFLNTRLKSIDLTSLVEMGSSVFAECEYLSDVTFGDELDMIGAKAFKDSGVENIITNGVTSISDSSFENCTALSSANIAHVTKLGNFAFCGCSNLTLAVSPELIEVGSGAFYSCGNLIDVDTNKSQTLGEQAFFNCTKLSSVELRSVRAMGQSVFEGCTELSAVTFPGIMQLPAATFRNCTSLKNITISEGVMFIASGAFENCSSLGEVTLPQSLLSIMSNAFSGCKIARMEIPQGVADIGSNALSGVSEIVVSPDNVFIDIKGGALYKKTKGVATVLSCLVGKPELTDIPPTVTEIAENAFRESAISEIHIPASVQIIGKYAFAYSELSVVTFEDGELSELKEGTFMGCEKLALAVIPESVVSIGASVFENCSALKSIAFESSEKVEIIGERAFFGSAILAIALPTSVTSIGKHAFASCADMQEFTFGNMIPDISVGMFDGCTKLKKFELSPSITRIGDEAFKNCSSIPSLTVEADYVGASAFSGWTSAQALTVKDISKWSPDWKKGCNANVTQIQ